MASSASSMLQTCRHLIWLYLTSVQEFTSGWRRIGGGAGLADSPDFGDKAALSLPIAAAVEGGGWVVAGVGGPRPFCREGASGLTAAAAAACDGSRTNCRHTRANQSYQKCIIMYGVKKY